MKTARLEAFSDGVIAIIITIMVLEMKVPHNPDPWALLKLWPVFASYALSFLMVAIYWVNHHHLIHLAPRADKRILWTNMLLLFCLSLAPFTTGYMGENHFTPFSVALYAFNMLLCAIAFYLLRSSIACHHKGDARMQELHKAMTRKNLISIALNAAALGIALFQPVVSLLILGGIAAAYFIPDQRVEKLQHGE